jgi:hypothetical protein
LILNDDAHTGVGIAVLDHRRRFSVANARHLRTIIIANQYVAGD